MGNAFHLRLVKVAIGKLAQGVSGRDVIRLRLCSGLPVDHVRDASGLKQALLDSISSKPILLKSSPCHSLMVRHIP
jgi:hypothetical protein